MIRKIVLKKIRKDNVSGASTNTTNINGSTSWRPSDRSGPRVIGKRDRSWSRGDPWNGQEAYCGNSVGSYQGPSLGVSPYDSGYNYFIPGNSYGAPPFDQLPEYEPPYEVLEANPFYEFTYEQYDGYPNYQMPPRMRVPDIIIDDMPEQAPPEAEKLDAPPGFQNTIYPTTTTGQQSYDERREVK